MYILLAILMFSFLIFIHELGHFVTAKLSGVRVNEFSMFMGPALWKKQVGETLYAIRLIPLGGYCAMEGEDEASADPRAFGAAAWWKRLAILLAGAAMNFLAGFLIFWGLFGLTAGYSQIPEPVIASFEAGNTIEGAQGLQVGDRIYEIDGERVYTASDISLLLSLNLSGDPDIHDLTVIRDGEKLLLNDFSMEKHLFQTESGEQLLYGMNLAQQERTFGNALAYTWANTVDNVRNVRLSLAMLISGSASISDISGPVGIVHTVSQVAEQSGSFGVALLNVLYFTAFLAINLAVMNLLPIPALDGGRAVLLLLTTAVEAVIGRKIDPKYEGYLHGAFMILLLGLMALVLFKDIFTIFRG